MSEQEVPRVYLGPSTAISKWAATGGDNVVLLHKKEHPRVSPRGFAEYFLDLMLLPASYQPALPSPCSMSSFKWYLYMETINSVLRLVVGSSTRTLQRSESQLGNLLIFGKALTLTLVPTFYRVTYQVSNSPQEVSCEAQCNSTPWYQYFESWA
ncbi:uncharacterized protein LACBIDRAFT_323966 [Laccaria bicolor S238N-H82]|uniref:Predicted protein n=1 Tax=Laccaria bicolor (strain S238N-H82 / ATCC MYA-4686) TaxID=486041 RepID=B0D072_LACBS|nr:uncharacterized protein LACBIDRAFT_323966 [Laccaria bicolor S238N-H82]EDR11778.1 predicted protein [Laccaria bicolor S238N-H82]|eukprot:XP_001877675.1 predicted protein [Laccaria bicolor S238N-H82]